MIDTFALVLSHALLTLAVWRLLGRDTLDAESPATGAGAAPGAEKRRRA